MISQFTHAISRRLLAPLTAQMEIQRVLAGQTRIHQLRDLSPRNLRAAEARIFSQGGEDGIIQKLIQHLPGIPPSFVEFGVQDYWESNTRFLLLNDYWRGLVLDGSAACVAAIRAQETCWRHGLEARETFVTREDIGAILRDSGFGGELGLLSIDIDGNDYWVWEAIEQRPWIVIVEYNSLFGSRGRFSVRYDRAFERTRAHHSNLYFGASLAALCTLAEHKGYVFVGANTLGANAFFVRRDVAAPFRALTVEEGFVATPSRQSRDAEGRLTFLDFEAGRRAIAHLPVHDFVEGRERPFGEAEGLNGPAT